MAVGRREKEEKNKRKTKTDEKNTKKKRRTTREKRGEKREKNDSATSKAKVVDVTDKKKTTVTHSYGEFGGVKGVRREKTVRHE